MNYCHKLVFKLKKFLFFTIIICFFSSSFVLASEVKDTKEEFFVKEFGLMTGFAQGGLEGEDDYEIFPLMLRFGYNLNTIEMGFTDLAKPIFDKVGLKPKGYTEFILEPFLNTVTSPDTNIEVGFSILLKFAYPLFDKFHLYGIGGGGVLYMSQHTNEQSTQYNFLPQVGGGFSYFIKENCAFNLEYRYRHLSNAGIDEPNSGINVDMILAGISWYY